MTAQLATASNDDSASNANSLRADNNSANFGFAPPQAPGQPAASAAPASSLFGVAAASGSALFGTTRSVQSAVAGAANPMHLSSMINPSPSGGLFGHLPGFHWEEPENLSSDSNGFSRDSNALSYFDGIIADVKDRYKTDGRAALTTDRFAEKVHIFGVEVNPVVYESDESDRVGGLRWTLEMTRYDSNRMRVWLRSEGATRDQAWSCTASASLRVHTQKPAEAGGRDLVMDALVNRALYASRSAETSRFAWLVPLHTLWGSQYGLIENDTIKMSARIAVKDVIGAKCGIDVVAEEILAEVRHQLTAAASNHLNDVDGGGSPHAGQSDIKQMLQRLHVDQPSSSSGGGEKLTKAAPTTVIERKLEDLTRSVAELTKAKRPPPSEADSRETVERIAKMRAETRLINAQAEAKELEVEEKRQARQFLSQPVKNVFC